MPPTLMWRHAKAPRRGVKPQALPLVRGGVHPRAPRRVADDVVLPTGASEIYGAGGLMTISDRSATIAPDRALPDDASARAPNARPCSSNAPLGLPSCLNSSS